MSLIETSSVAKEFSAMYPMMPATTATATKINVKIDADFLHNIF
jgi:hypothetical protein